MDIIVMLIIIVLLILAFTFLPGFKADGGSGSTGLPKKALANSGTDKLKAKMKGLARSNGWRYVENCRLTKDGVTKEIPAMVVGPFGVLAVNAVGRNGEIYGTAADEEWVQITDGGKTRFENPFSESAYMVRMIRDVLFAEKQKSVYVECFPVFCAKKVQLGVPKSLNAVTLKQLGKKLGADKYYEDKGVDFEKIADALGKTAQQEKLPMEEK